MKETNKELEPHIYVERLLDTTIIRNLNENSSHRLVVNLNVRPKEGHISDT